MLPLLSILPVDKTIMWEAPWMMLVKEHALAFVSYPVLFFGPEGGIMIIQDVCQGSGWGRACYCGSWPKVCYFPISEGVHECEVAIILFNPGFCFLCQFNISSCGDICPMGCVCGHFARLDRSYLDSLCAVVGRGGEQLPCLLTSYCRCESR